MRFVVSLRVRLECKVSLPILQLYEERVYLTGKLSAIITPPTKDEDVVGGALVKCSFVCLKSIPSGLI